MSQENVDVVRKVYADWMQGNFRAGEVFHPEVEFAMPDWPEGTDTRGREEMARAWQAALSAWDDFVAVPGEMLDAGEHVVVITHVTGRGKSSGVETRATTATMWTFEAVKVVRLGLYWNSAKALEAAGVSE